MPSPLLVQRSISSMRFRTSKGTGLTDAFRRREVRLHRWHPYIRLPSVGGDRARGCPLAEWLWQSEIRALSPLTLELLWLIPWITRWVIPTFSCHGSRQCHHTLVVCRVASADFNKAGSQLLKPRESRVEPSNSRLPFTIRSYNPFTAFAPVRSTLGTTRFLPLLLLVFVGREIASPFSAPF